MVSQLGFAYLQRSHWENCHYELEGSFWTWKHLANLHLSFCLLRPEANDTSAWDYYICALMHLLYLFQSPAWREKTYHKKYTKRAKKISCHSVKQKSFNLWLSRNCHNFFSLWKLLWTGWKSHSFTRIPLSPSSLGSNQKGSWTLLDFFFKVWCKQHIFLGCVEEVEENRLVGGAQKKITSSSCCCTMKRACISQAKMRSWEVPFAVSCMKQWAILTPHHNPIRTDNRYAYKLRICTG